MLDRHPDAELSKQREDVPRLLRLMAVLEAREVGAAHACLFRQLLLGEARLSPKLLDGGAER